MAPRDLGSTTLGRPITPQTPEGLRHDLESLTLELADWAADCTAPYDCCFHCL